MADLCKRPFVERKNERPTEAEQPPPWSAVQSYPGPCFREEDTEQIHILGPAR